MIEKLTKIDDSSYPYLDKEGISHQTVSSYIQGILGFCGCGDPDSVMIWVRDMLLDIDNRNFKMNEKDEHKMFFLYWLDKEGYTEHGCSISGSWLTELGKELINDINWCIKNELNKGL